MELTVLLCGKNSYAVVENPYDGKISTLYINGL